MAVSRATIRRVAGDPEAVRAVLELAGLLTMDAVAARLDISYYRVKMLRKRRVDVDTESYIAGTPPLPRSDALPRALPIPGDPLWHPEEIETWGRQTGRLGPDGTPQRALPTGRPRKVRTAEPA